MKRVIPAVLLIAALLTGCAVPGLSAAQANLSAQDEFFAGNAQQTEQYRPALLEPQQVCLWGRQQLEPELQTVYDQLAQAAACHDEEPVAVDADQEQVRLCLLALRTDHPEYFWFDGEGTYVTTSVPVLEDSTSVTLTYTMTEEDARAQLPQVERYVADCIASLDGAENDYQKILGVYQYIIRQTDYVLDVQDQSIISVMTQHQGTCADHIVAIVQLDAANACCVSAHGTNIGLIEADCHALMGADDDIIIAVGSGNGDQLISLLQTQGADTGLSGGIDLGKPQTLDRTVPGDHHQIFVLSEFTQQHHCGDLLPLLQWENIDNIGAAGCPASGII